MVLALTAVLRAPAQVPSTGVSPLADLESLQAAFAQLAEKLRPSVVAIHADRRVRVPETQGMPDDPVHRSVRVPSIGSGVVIRADGMILTNEHVVRDADKVTVVLFDRSRHEAKAVYADPRADLAIVHIEAGGLTPARLGDLSRVRQGHWAFAMGNPFGLASDGNMVMSEGIVSAVRRKLDIDPTNSRYYGNLIQTSAAINPGNSGGPLVNIYGEVIGITTAISTRTGANEGIGFAVPIEARTRAIIETLLRGETVEYGFLGVTVRMPERPSGGAAGAAVGGATIESVEPGSPADRANFKPGDTILEFDGSRVEDPDHLVRLVGASPVGKQIVVVFDRDGRISRAPVTIGRRPVMEVAETDTLKWRGMKLSDPTLTVRRRFRLPPGAKGLVITEVEPKSAAERAGLKPGQRILKVGELDITTVERLGDVLPTLTRAVTLTLADHAPVKIEPD